MRPRAFTDWHFVVDPLIVNVILPTSPAKVFQPIVIVAVVKMSALFIGERLSIPR